LQTVSLVGALPFTFVLLGEVIATYKTFKIHIGELDPSKLVYWKYDIIESFYRDTMQWIWAFLLPPFVQMQTRNKIISKCEMLEDTDPRKTAGFTRSSFQFVWTVGYFSLFFLVILFGFLELAEDGFKFLALAMWLFWIVLCVGNRQLIKAHYGIDSSNICFDILSWTFCWCYAGVQENLQAREGELVQIKDLVVKEKMNGATSTPNSVVELQQSHDNVVSDSGGGYTE